MVVSVVDLYSVGMHSQSKGGVGEVLSNGEDGWRPSEITRARKSTLHCSLTQ